MKVSAVALRDALVSGLSIFAIGALAGFMVYLDAAIALKEEVRQNLRHVALEAANLTDVRTHQKITLREHKGNADYEAVRKPYLSLLRANPDLAYIYTNVERDGKIVFIVDSSIPKPGQKDIPTDVLQEYTDATASLRSVFRTHEASVEKDTYTDDWGTFLSAYAPLYEGDTFIGTVGVDIRVDAFQAHMSGLRGSLGIGLVVSFLAGVTAGILVYLNRLRNLVVAEEAARQSEAVRQIAAEKLLAETAAASSQARRQEALDQAVSTLRANLDDVLLTLNDAASTLDLHAGEVAKANQLADEKTGQVLRISATSTELSEQIARSTHELSRAIADVHEQSQVSRRIAEDAALQSEAAARALSELTDKSEKVGEVTSLIADVAGQINLLSLNATIEAARAGEAGKGFAVVATEVKNLSSRVSLASQEITRQISDVQSATSHSVNAMENIRATVAEAYASAQRVAAAVAQQRAATSEIDAHIGDSAVGSRQIQEDLMGVSLAMQSADKAAGAVNEAANRLRTNVQSMKAHIERFADEVA